VAYQGSVRCRTGLRCGAGRCTRSCPTRRCWRSRISHRGDIERPQQWTLDDLAALPRREVRARDRDGTEVTFAGVALVDLLRLAGVPLGEKLRGSNMALYLLVDAADGYRVVFALPELDPAFTERVVLLADHRDGQPLAAAEGPLHLVVPDEKRQARWVRQVGSCTVRRAP
jgi:DMSO/TMAO reductase YedYZ molybdopterin-dependent catalytic subunit